MQRDSILRVSRDVCRKYLRYADTDRQNLYGRALAYYLIYSQKYLGMEGIDCSLLFFLAKAARYGYRYPKSQIGRITDADVESYFGRQA